MTEEEKKVYMLLKSVIFHYHGLDDLERQDLEDTSKRLDAVNALAWSLDFIAKDYITAFERARTYLNEIIGDYPRQKRVELINMVWDANNLKGYVTEMEATAMLKLAKDWGVENELVVLVTR
ncbi:MAG: hypothetical protein OJF59_000976 [Cytophagales bacterium]|jgi:hypothetical protein|nr:hypothetical protein [Bacteroidota bacterium]MBS1980027.1 hypothetical protein [Bacteroidota bacterium]WHZ07223.1 MAG: hypothetical protein OJF59_000976 [Cytophagales bacterium]